MCVNDWRLGRLVRSTGKNIAIAPASAIVVLPNKQRVGLCFAFNNDPLAAGSTFSVTFDNGVIIGSQGFFPYLMISLLEFGDLSTHGATVAGFSVAGVVNVSEYIMPEEYLAVALEKFKTDYGLKGY